MTVSDVFTSRGLDQGDDAQLSDRRLILLILFGSVLSLLHSPWMFLAVLPAVLATLTSLRSSPHVWLISGGLCLAVAATDWAVFEDHVFFGGYQLVAIGIALTRHDFRASINLQLRWLTGALFAVAVVWKLTSSSYMSGNLFRTVLLFDNRFDPITRLVGGASSDALANDRELLLAIGRGDVVQSQGLETASALSFVSAPLTVWTIAIELLIAIAFLAPDHWSVSRLRHPALLTFCLTTYAMVPVLGFAVMLSAVGLSFRIGPWTRRLYLLVPAVAFVRFIATLIWL